MKRDFTFKAAPGFKSTASLRPIKYRYDAYYYISGYSEHYQDVYASKKNSENFISGWTDTSYYYVIPYNVTTYTKKYKSYVYLDTQEGSYVAAYWYFPPGTTYYGNPKYMYYTVTYSYGGRATGYIKYYESVTNTNYYNELVSQGYNNYATRYWYSYYLDYSYKYYTINYGVYYTHYTA